MESETQFPRSPSPPGADMFEMEARSIGYTHAVDGASALSNSADGILGNDIHEQLADKRRATAHIFGRRMP